MRANRFSQVFSFTVMAAIKTLSYPFYRFKINWIDQQADQGLEDVKLIVLLNHTSLYEALFVRLASYRYLWRLARHVLVPVADITTSRPVVGKFFRALIPGIIPISRKRDDSWDHFLSKVNEDAIVAILPEGRMRRHDGKDKNGKPMSIRAGVSDIIETLEQGNILFVYSGGLHHIQIPGQRLPKIFKTIKTNMEVIDVSEYKQQMHHEVLKRRKLNIVRDIETRLKNKTPYCAHQPYNKKAPN